MKLERDEVQFRFLTVALELGSVEVNSAEYRKR